MSLQQQIPELLAHAQKHSLYLQHNEKLFNIYEGELLPYIEEALRKQMSEQSFEQLQHRIAPLNVLRKLIDKLSRIYGLGGGPTRNIVEGSETDKELLSWYEEQFKINQKLNVSNEFLNLFKTSLIGPFVHEGKPQLRIIPSDRFIPYTTDEIDPTNPTHQILYMGEMDKLGKVTKDIMRVKVFHAYTDDEFIIFDSEGDILRDKMTDLGNSGGSNIFGKIPFVYLNRSQNLLIPKQDSDTFKLSVLLPLLVSDLNAVAMYQSFSVIYFLGLTAKNLRKAPDAVWILEQSGDPDQKTEVGTIKPEADIDQILRLIQAELSFWLNTRGIKPGSIGDLTADNAVSGISKIIDESDVSEARQKDVEAFTDGEEEFWNLITKYMHPVWAKGGLIENRALFTPNVKIAINFAEQVPLVRRGDLIKEQKEEVASGFTTRRRAIKKLNPKASDEEIDEILEEIDEERTVNIEKMQDAMSDGAVQPNSPEGNVQKQPEQPEADKKKAPFGKKDK